eukprot:s861_g23.t1
MEDLGVGGCQILRLRNTFLEVIAEEDGADALRRRIGWRRRIVKTNWVAQTHCEDTLGRRRRIAKTHWVGEDALRRRIGVAKTASGDALPGYGPGADASRSRFHDITATSRVRGQLHMHDSHDS